MDANLMMRSERLAALSCYDCGAPFDPVRGAFSCQPDSGSGITFVTEEQMAGGEQVTLNRRVYLDESKTQAIKEGVDAVGAWLYGVAGSIKSKAEAEGLGLTEGDDFDVPGEGEAAPAPVAGPTVMDSGTSTVSASAPVVMDSAPPEPEAPAESEAPAEPAPAPAAKPSGGARSTSR